MRNIVFFFMMLLFSCGENKNRESIKNAGDTLGVSEPKKDSNLLKKLILAKLPEWVNHWRSVIPEFDPENFSQNYKGKLPDLVTELQDYQSEDYFNQYMIYSPDSSMYIDLYSYGMEIIRRNGRFIASFSPDVEAAVVDVENQRRHRLLFIGTMGKFEDAFWISGEELIIVGNGELDTGYSPVFWHICLNDSTLKNYAYSRSTNYDVNSYLSLKFDDLEID